MTMDERTLTALKGSIAKWEAIVAGTGYDDYADNCPLCKEFYHSKTGILCGGCPVRDRTGRGGCSDSPWDAWNDHIGLHLGTRAVHPDCPECGGLAQAELDFLKSLMPNGETA